MSFSFGFSGDDIENDIAESQPSAPAAAQPPASTTYSAFPVPGKPQLPATVHSLSDFLSQLPSKIAYDLLDIEATDAGASETQLRLPRRELWDVRVQLMAEDDEVTNGEDRVDDGGLGKHDVKTGIYEGGFKSWESSIDLVKVLAAQDELSAAQEASSLRVIEVSRRQRERRNEQLTNSCKPFLSRYSWVVELPSLLWQCLPGS